MYKSKIFGAVIVTAILCASFVMVLPDGDAGNVGSSTITDITGGTPAETFYDSTWHLTEDYGIAVGEAGAIYSIQDPVESAGDWTDMTTNAGDTWFGTEYNGSEIVICGLENGGGNNVYNYTSGGGLTGWGISNPGDSLMAAAHGTIGDGWLFVGYNGATPLMYYRDLEGNFNAVTGTSIPVNEDKLYDVTYDEFTQTFVIVGANGANNGVTYYVSETDLIGGTYNTLQTGAFTDAALYAVDWNPEFANEHYGLAVGAESGVFKIDNNGGLTEIDQRVVTWTNTYTFKDVSFAPDAGTAEKALIVGGNGTNDTILRFQDYDSVQGDTIANVTGMGRIDGMGPMNTAVYKPKMSPGYAVILGASAGMKVNAVEAHRTMTIATIYPHIINITMEEGLPGSLNGSVLNSNVHVDLYYTLTVEAYHDYGWDQVGTIDVYMWHDDQGVYPGTEDDNDNAHFLFTNGPDTFGRPDQLTAEDEIQLIPAQCSDTPSGPNHSNVTFVFYIKSQVWANTGPFGESSPGFSSMNQSDSGTALGDTDTWDIQVTITDTTSSGSDSKYDEFGIYIYTEVANGGPPSDQTGSGAPGALITLGPAGEDVRFVANHEYALGVHGTDMWNGAATERIQVTTLSIEAGNTVGFAPLTGEGVTTYIFGSGVSWIAPNQAGSYTETSGAGLNGAEDGDATNTPVTWQGLIPVGVGEDTYTGTVTYHIEHS